MSRTAPPVAEEIFCSTPRCANAVGEPDFPYARYALGYVLCKVCGDNEATRERKSWTVLTPHKQGPMFFTRDDARAAAVGINNKGGLVR